MSRARSNSKWRPVVKGAAAAALAAAFATPLLRKKLNVPAGATVAAMAAGPPALAVLKPRTRTRDAGLFALQMWGFLNAKDMPTDDMDALRERLRVDYPIRADMAIGRGELPNMRLQRALSGVLPAGNPLESTLSWVHWLWFFEPHTSLVWILARHPERFPRSARQMAAVFDIGCAVYAAVPTAPPWWASEQGRTEGQEVQADHGRGGQEAVGARLGADVRLPRRQPLGRDALAALRRVADGGDPADRGGPGRGRRSGGPTAARSGSRSSTSGSTT